MDQFVVGGAVANRAILLDCRSLKFELLPLPAVVCVVICNSMVKHAVATGEYGNRRDEVEAGQAVLRDRLGFELLRDATLSDLETCRAEMSAASFLRCRHYCREWPGEGGPGGIVAGGCETVRRCDGRGAREYAG
jgi:galactokinase